MNAKPRASVDMDFQQDDVYPHLPSEEDIIIYTTRVVRNIKGCVNNKDIISLLLLKLETESNPDLQDRYRSALQRVVYMTLDDR